MIQTSFVNRTRIVMQCYICAFLFLLYACSGSQKESAPTETVQPDTASARGATDKMEAVGDDENQILNRGSAEGLKFILYPNPARDLLYLEVNEMVDDMRYFIASSSGQIVSYGDLENQKESINIEGLEDGTYYVKVISKYHPKPVTERLVVQH